MSYEVAKFVKPVRFNDSQSVAHNEQQSLEYFRFERNASPMAEIVREYLSQSNKAQQQN